MKLLLVAATKGEIEPLINSYGSQNQPISFGSNTLNILITGVGMVATSYAIGRELGAETYDFAINAGIAGSFDPSIQTGELVMVKEDHLAELGAENNDQFLTIDDMGFGESHILPLNTVHPKVSSLLSNLRSVRGITVNTVHGNTNSIAGIVKRLNPQVESMEGAAFFYSCNQAKLPSVQIRAISNKVEQRNPANWNIPLAVKNLNDYLVEFLNQL